MGVTFEQEMEKLDDIFGGEEVYRSRVGFGADYAAPVNYGGEPHWPPLKPMYNWTSRMGWENYGLDGNMSEGEMWDYVDERRNSREPLPAAYNLASHVADEGTEAMMYASDAFSQAQAEGESWMESRAEDVDSLRRLALDFGNWTLELAEDNLIERVSSATTGPGGLLGSMQPAELI